MSFCANCGNWVYSKDKTCSKCGKDPNKKIEEKIPEPEEPPKEEVSVKEVSSPATPPADDVPESSEVVSEPLDDVLEFDDASLEKLDEEIIRIEEAESSENQSNSFNVCPKCGSPEIGPVPTNVDVLDALYKPAKYYCRNCGYEGIPFILDGEKAFQSFLDSRSKSLSENVEPQPKPLYGVSSSFDKGTSKKPYVAAFLSFLWPGLGQAYNSQGWKALLFFIVAIATLFFSSYIRSTGELTLGYLLFIAVWVCIVLDAYFTARATNKKK
jgi:DNA-directed RNA polymerase subunit M/transcription elongation factor TFIIS